MPKVYADWNIYSQIANGRNDDLQNILTQDNLMLLYSIYHLSDVRKSIVKAGGIDDFISRELKTLSYLTNDRCFFREPDGTVKSGIISPEEYLDSLELQESLLNNFNLDFIFDSFNLSEYTKLFDVIKFELRNGEYPDLNLGGDSVQDRSIPNNIDDFLKFAADTYKDLTTTDSFKEMRIGFQKTGVDHKTFHSNENPLEIIEAIFRERGFGELGEVMYGFKFDKDDWFDKIVNLYLTLDTCGYRSDSINVNAKKSQTFLNLLNDAHHTAFASRCEFYITDDKKGRDKAQAVYNYLGIKTKVFGSSEFKDYSRKYLSDYTFSETYSRLKEIMQSEASLEVSKAESTSDNAVYEVHTDYYLFTYFNKIYLTQSDDEYFTMVLAKEMSANTKYFILFEEVFQFVKVMVDYLGVDAFDKGEYGRDEDLKGDKVLRHWVLQDLVIELAVLNQHLCIYFYYYNQ